jgi:hypothetical protein
MSNIIRHCKERQYLNLQDVNIFLISVIVFCSTLKKVILALTVRDISFTFTLKYKYDVQNNNKVIFEVLRRMYTTSNQNIEDLDEIFANFFRLTHKKGVCSS